MLVKNKVKFDTQEITFLEYIVLNNPHFGTSVLYSPKIVWEIDQKKEGGDCNGNNDSNASTD